MKEKRILERYNGLKLGWLRDSLFFIAAIAVVFVMFKFVIGLSVVGGDSMNPTLTDGQLVMYLRVAGDYEPDDVVAVRVPSGDFYIKRVVATGGSTVDVFDGKLYVDGVEAKDVHAAGLTEEETGAVIYPYTVRDGNVFVLGDNRQVSMDSRMFGEVNKRQIKGKIILCADRHGIHKVD